MTDEMRVKTEDNELTLAEMSAALPDTPTIMTRVGESWWHFIYAARGGNWGLAEYYLKRVRKLENSLKVLRPKHAERLERFQATALPEVWNALEAQDLARLEAAFAAATDMAKRFMRAYRKARAWLIETPAAEVAGAESAFFPEIDRAVLAATIAYYQKLGCWTPHVEITRPAFEVAVDVFQHSGLITKRHRYEDVVAPPPDAA